MFPELMSAFVTIVYCYRNRDTDRVTATLNSLKEQTSHDFRVLFVDYGSDNNVAEKVRSITEQFDFVEHLYSDTRYMPWNRSHALNTGIRRAETDHVFTADIDMVFVPGFIEKLRTLASADSATFFKVAYLKPGVDPVALKRSDVDTLSAEHALGLALIPVRVLQMMNGYDEFYRFWGREDNDIRARLYANGTKTTFYDEILMYHIHHPPANTTDILPERWLQFQNDYLNQHKNMVERNEGYDWGKVIETSERKAMQHLLDPETKFVEFSGFVRYFRYSLEQLFSRTGPGQVFAIRFEDNISEQYESRKLSRLVRSSNKLLGMLGIPISLRSDYDFSYMDLKMITDEFYFWLASNRNNVKDHALHKEGKSVKIVVQRN